MKRFIRINENDNVIIALEDINKGDQLDDIIVNEDIKQGHKIALMNITKGNNIIKYGYPIGKAKNDINKGDWIHVHNVSTNLDENRPFCYNHKVYENSYKNENKKVNVYLRKNGKVGIRNELWIIPTVGCVNGQAKKLVEVFKSLHQELAIDGVYTFTHPYGCSQMGDDHINTRTSLQNIVTHPNCGGVLVLGLGCENNQISTFKETLKDYDEDRVKFLNIQSVSNEIEEGIKILNSLYDLMKNDRRSKQDLSLINIGLKCGGSDGLSGITANPLLGCISDYMVNQGGSAVLTEIPEMFGAEDILLERCQNDKIYYKLLNCIDCFKEYYRKNNQVIYENPSPGNKQGGITTLEDKSLGCVQKGGTSQVVDVLNHTEKLSVKGLNVLTGPGNDIVATTGLGMCGCQLVLFTTGRGTPLGSFVPVIKVSTNTELALKKQNWIDFNSGELNSKNQKQVFNDFINLIIDVIEGKQTKSEKNDFREIAIFKSGVTL